MRILQLWHWILGFATVVKTIVLTVNDSIKIRVSFKIWCDGRGIDTNRYQLWTTIAALQKVDTWKMSQHKCINAQMQQAQQKQSMSSNAAQLHKASKMRTKGHTERQVCHTVLWILKSLWFCQILTSTTFVSLHLQHMDLVKNWTFLMLKISCLIIGSHTSSNWHHCKMWSSNQLHWWLWLTFQTKVLELHQGWKWRRRWWWGTFPCKNWGKKASSLVPTICSCVGLIQRSTLACLWVCLHQPDCPLWTQVCHRVCFQSLFWMRVSSSHPYQTSDRTLTTISQLHLWQLVCTWGLKNVTTGDPMCLPFWTSAAEEGLPIDFNCGQNYHLFKLWNEPRVPMALTFIK